MFIKNKIISISKDFIKKFPENSYVWIVEDIISEKESNLQGNSPNYYDNNGKTYVNPNDLESLKGNTKSIESDGNYSGNQAIRNQFLDPITLIPESNFLLIFKLVKVGNKIQGVDLEFELLNISGEFVKNFWLQAELLNKKGEFLKAEEILIFENIEINQIAKATGVWERVDAYNIGFIKIKPYVIEACTQRNFKETQKIFIQPNIFDIVVTF
ncbi:MAG: hypothetical protein JEY97_02725 [Bacteroidales bacterium]|nr:hypothetical protein [Bacteroidales bacterium]